MDPRHPEQAISRMRELMEQYNRVEAGMKEAVTSANLAELEREASLVVQEICLVAPRLHEAMMQTSRQRRHDLAHGVLDEPQDTAVELGARTKYKQPFESVEKSQEKCVNEAPKQPEKCDGTEVDDDDNFLDEAFNKMKHNGEKVCILVPEKEYAEMVDVPKKEIPTPPNQAETVIVEPKPRKKKTTKKAEK